MAVRAHEDAFLRLGASRGERQTDAAGADRQSLLERVQMMKLKGTHVPVVATQTARPTRFGDEDRFDASPSRRDPFLATKLASVVAPPF
ncbi:MAG: hypothetical protein ABI323_13700 [Solirubrobacteraceae bacterium]